VLVASDIGRGVLLLSIPVAYAFNALELWQLYVIAFVTGSLTALFDVASLSYLPAVIERDDLVDANARLQISQSFASIGGPQLGGTLMAIWAAPFALIADALSFIVSGAFISSVRKREAKPDRRLDAHGRPTSLRTEMVEGLAFVAGNRYLRPIALSTSLTNLCAAAVFSVFPVLIWTELKLSTAFCGLVMGLAAVGFLVGAALSNKLPRAIGLGPTILLSAGVSAPAYLLMTLTPAALPVAAVTLFVGQFVAGLSMVVYNVAQISLRQAITPPELQSRMNATMRFIVWGTIPIGSIIGGVLASVMPIRMALVIAAVASFSAFIPVVMSPLRSLRDIPSATDGGDAHRLVGVMGAAGEPEPEPEPGETSMARAAVSGMAD
jgi:MFS family permease